MVGVKIELAAGELARLDALVKAQQAAGELEDALQSPLEADRKGSSDSRKYGRTGQGAQA